MFATEWTLGQSGAKEALAIRKRVFVEELGRPDEAVFDPFDEYAAHLLVRLDGAPIASARLYAAEDGALRMDNACVLKEYRGQRFGDLCFRLLMNKAANMGASTLTLLSAAQHVPYFEGFGFRKVSEEGDFSLLGIDPADLTWPSQCGSAPAAGS